MQDLPASFIMFLLLILNVSPKYGLHEQRTINNRTIETGWLLKEALKSIIIPLLLLWLQTTQKKTFLAQYPGKQ